MAKRLVGRHPQPGRDRLLADLVPPPRFAHATFDSYRPDSGQPSQAEAVQRLQAAAAAGAEPRRRLFGSRPSVPAGGVYLDGGYGVGKTHLLAALFHATSGRRHYGTFVEYTHLAGALGFRGAVDALSGAALVCIDEFELDDPGDTVLVARLLREVSEHGTRLAATSNTLPGALGAERFAAEDFLREIQAVGALFEVVTVDGEDYRHRGQPEPPEPSNEDALTWLAQLPGAVVDDFDALCGHLGTLHPSRYRALLDGVQAAGWRGVRTIEDQATALRVVVLADRLYDRAVPLCITGQPLAGLFAEDMLAGGYRKKYLRALSRLTALTRDAEALRSSNGPTR